MNASEIYANSTLAAIMLTFIPYNIPLLILLHGTLYLLQHCKPFTAKFLFYKTQQGLCV